jgi:hypothetical protein
LEKYLRDDGERETVIRAAEESMMAWRIYLDGIHEAGQAGASGKGF